MATFTNADGVQFTVEPASQSPDDPFDTVNVLGPDGQSFYLTPATVYSGNVFTPYPQGANNCFVVLPGQNAAELLLPQTFELNTGSDSRFPVNYLNLYVGGTAELTVDTPTPVAMELNLNVLGGSLYFDALGGESTLDLYAGVSYGGVFTLGEDTTAGEFGRSSLQVSFGSGGGTLELSGLDGSAVASVGGLIIGFDSRADIIQDDGVKLSQVKTYTVAVSASTASETFAFFDASGHTLDSVTAVGSPAAAGTYHAGVTVPGSLLLSADTDGDLLVTTQCFLPGTRIATPNGEVAVEMLRTGMQVTTRLRGETRCRAINRIIRRHMDATEHGNALDAYPVRIRRGALAENVPRRDLLLTGEHCVLLNNGLMPVRMLVNGGSILRDTTHPRYDHYHIDVGDHAILIAEGMETESYLGADDLGEARPRAAPLTVASATVEPVWQRLAARGAQLGFPAAALPAYDGDPHLHLVAADGTRIAPVAWDGDRATFRLPGGADRVRIASRAARPDRAIGPFIDDRRMLGVKIGAIALAAAGGEQFIQVADGVHGWHIPEPDGRWTDGDALLQLGEGAGVPGGILTLHVVGRMRYRSAARAA